MQTFLVGVLVGFGIFGVVSIITLLSKIHTEMTIIKNTMQLVWSRLGKLEKMTEATMGAAENFVDALQRSAEGMMYSPPPDMQNPTDDFSDLRETFEGGIRKLEEDSEDSEDDSDSPDEEEDNWKGNK